MGHKEIDARQNLYATGCASGNRLRSEPVQEKWFQVNNLSGLLWWLYLKHALDAMHPNFGVKVP